MITKASSILGESNSTTFTNPIYGAWNCQTLPAVFKLVVVFAATNTSKFESLGLQTSGKK